MSVFLTGLLDFLLAYGYLALALSVFIASIGAPLPISLLLLAAGAFSAQGDFNIVFLGLIAVASAVAGDCAGYWIGWRWGSKALAWLPQSRVGSRFIRPRDIARSREYVHRHGGWAIFLTRSLLSALGSVTNLIAGTESFPFRSFLLYDISGEALVTVLTLGLGFLFDESWEAMGDILGAISLFTLGLACLLLFTSIFLGYHKRAGAKSKQRIAGE